MIIYNSFSLSVCLRFCMYVYNTNTYEYVMYVYTTKKLKKILILKYKNSKFYSLFNLRVCMWQFCNIIVITALNMKFVIVVGHVKVIYN